jgi:ribosomal protein S18 acetylase RimI-like enzyme
MTMNVSAPSAPTSAPSIDVGRCIATLTVAFSADPIIRWFLPDSARFLTHFPQILHLMGDDAFATGTADLADAAAGAALWISPTGSVDQDGIVGLVASSVDADRHEAVFGFLEQMDEHHPTEPHWYLPFIGVDPDRQGRGHGSALLERGLARCDRDRLPAYLEASSARNRSLYERHGFEAFAEVRCGDSPPMWPMLRPAS